MTPDKERTWTLYRDKTNRTASGWTEWRVADRWTGIDHERRAFVTVQEVTEGDGPEASGPDFHKWVRCFNRLEKAVQRHEDAKTGVCDDADDALHHAHRKVMEEAATAPTYSPLSQADREVVEAARDLLRQHSVPFSREEKAVSALTRLLEPPYQDSIRDTAERVAEKHKRTLDALADNPITEIDKRNAGVTDEDVLQVLEHETADPPPEARKSTDRSCTPAPTGSVPGPTWPPKDFRTDAEFFKGQLQTIDSLRAERDTALRLLEGALPQLKLVDANYAERDPELDNLRDEIQSFLASRGSEG